MQGLCAEKKAIGPRKSLDCSTLQSIADKESANRDQARERRTHALIEAADVRPPSKRDARGIWSRGAENSDVFGEFDSLGSLP